METYSSEEVGRLVHKLLEKAPCEFGYEKESWCKEHDCETCDYEKAWQWSAEFSCEMMRDAEGKELK